jgi:hypothetical protein
MVMLVLFLIIVVLTFQFRAAGPQPNTIRMTELAEDVRRGSIARIVVDGNEAEAIYSNGASAIVRKEPSKTLVEQLLELGVPQEALSAENIEIEIKDPGLFGEVGWFPLLIAGGMGALLGASLTLIAVRFGYFRD